MTLLLYVLVVAARLSLRFAVAAAVVATALYNFYFLPPIGTFTISDPQNWLALFAFLATSIIGSRLSQKAREEADQARNRQRELEVLFALSRELLQTENVADLVNAMPTLINIATRAERATLYLLEGDRLYQAGDPPEVPALVSELRQRSLSLPTLELSESGTVDIPLRAGVRPRGLLSLTGVRLSQETLLAIGGLASVALDRAQALEDVARSEAGKESERLRTLILDSITHELKTPLTSIKAATGTLQEMTDVSAEDRRDLLAVIDEEADRLNRLVGQAVEMAQIETQEVHMSFTAVDLRVVVAEAQESCAWVSTTHPLTVTIPELPKVSVDVAMIIKVLCNLIENAAKYSEPESPIFISAERKGGYVIASIADRGIGIDPAEQGLIFDRLYRSRQQGRQKPGTGMGLAISRAIVDSHHGKLTVTSQVAHGSVFSFSLPIAESSAV
jgi:two-component system sensor histidine kinase KdpD